VKKIIFDFNLENACVDKKKLEENLKKLEPEVDRIGESLQNSYDSDYASINLPSDKACLESVMALIENKKKLDIEMLIVIGIGGSNLGTIAVHRAIHGDFYNDRLCECGNNELGGSKNHGQKGQIMPKVYFADTVDTDYICDLLKIAELELKAGKNILINLITKSGTTTETVANFEVFLHLLKKYKPKNYYDYIVAITDNGSNLWDYAKKNNIACLQVPIKVGGRYSVFSPVGLFPLGFLGINIEDLLSGAQSILPECLRVSECDSLQVNQAAISAAIIHENYINGKNIHDTFIFSKYLKYFGCWYRQLVGESIGKKLDKFGDIVHVGITPTTSVGSVDLHSVAQLYLGGPMDKFTTFITVEPKCEIVIPEEKDFEEFVENIHGKSLKFVMNALANGTKEAYKNDKRPFVSMHMPLVDEYFMGQLLQFKMFEVIYFGFLLNVNPFDQPQVELYKKEARKILVAKK
jgi:glucose-6-phosphate isomerase